MGDCVKNRKKRAWRESLKRLVRFRLIVPIRRSHHSPEYSARGTLVGLAWAFTPLIGIQMYLCLMTWLIARKLFKWDFSLLIACAWTWTTNMVTLVPTYYMFYITGYRMLGIQRHADYSRFARFLQTIKEAFAADAGMWSALKITASALAKDFGLVMLVGCIPYMIFFGWLGYRCTLKYVLARRARLKAKSDLQQRA
jgi:uncharacterized protein (DUF2062 family)